MFSQRVPARYLGHRRPHGIRSCSRFLLGGWRFRLPRTLGTWHDREHLGRRRRLALNGLHPHGSGAVRLRCLAGHDSQRTSAIFVRRRWLSDPGRCLAAGLRAAGAVAARRLRPACVRAGVGPSLPLPPAASKGLCASPHRSRRQAAFDRARMFSSWMNFSIFRLCVQVATGDTFSFSREDVHFRT